MSGYRTALCYMQRVSAVLNTQRCVLGELYSLVTDILFKLFHFVSNHFTVLNL